MKEITADNYKSELPNVLWGNFQKMLEAGRAVAYWYPESFALRRNKMNDVITFEEMEEDVLEPCQICYDAFPSERLKWDENNKCMACDGCNTTL